MRSLTLFFISLSIFVSKDKDIFSSKAIENRMVKVSTYLYANKYETSNAEYREFLDWIKENNKDLLDEARIHEEGWSKVMGLAYTGNYSDHERFDNYPVVNVTYEGALAFCAWLTDRYNQSKKKKFNEVKFRLPTKEEWVSMALNGGHEAQYYPWGGPYLKNKQGHYLANFFRIGNQDVKLDINDQTRSSVALEPQLDKDGNTRGGMVFTTSVDSYMATGAGLHNLSGNAAEMLAEKGKTKGGSWGSSGYYLRIHAEDEFEGFDYSPYVGFRYMMEVIEE
ncbi:MAG: hypothetical protein Roseis2KO_56120 [Roseivirga sp.]